MVGAGKTNVFLVYPFLSKFAFFRPLWIVTIDGSASPELNISRLLYHPLHSHHQDSESSRQPSSVAQFREIRVFKLTTICACPNNGSMIAMPPWLRNLRLYLGAGPGALLNRTFVDAKIVFVSILPAIMNRNGRLYKKFAFSQPFVLNFNSNMQSK